MHPLVAAILGIVEGVTEYLPISSTGHLILASRMLGLKGDAVDSFSVVIQLGAILAVLVHYRRLLWQRTAGLARRERASFQLLAALAVGFAPTAILGLLLHKKIKALLFGPWPVAAALIVGGILMILVERHRAKNDVRGLVGLEHVTPKRALMIGLGQCVSMWPGSSRSMCTIVAGQLSGLSTATAAEFSFLLGLPTLGAATLYETYKSRAALATLGTTSLVVGLVVSFVVAWAVVSWFIGFLQRRGLFHFGVYRIILGVIVLLVLTR